MAIKSDLIMADDTQSPPQQTDTDADHNDSPEIHFEPLVNLPPVEIKTLEENENILLQIRAKLFRYDTESDPNEWKERGVGECRILKHKETGFVRILMRRDKTLKICANHYINPSMELKPNCGSERAWVWSTTADFADEECKGELLAIRFGNVDNAQKFKTVFDESREAMKPLLEGSSPEVLTSQLKGMSLKEAKGDTKDADKPNSEEKDLSQKESKVDTKEADKPTSEAKEG